MKKVFAAILVFGFLAIAFSACSSRQGCPGGADNYKFSGRGRGVWK
jgi:hypothetical protein